MCFEKFNKTGQILHSTLQFLSGGLIKYHQFHYTVFSENLLKNPRKPETQKNDGCKTNMRSITKK